MGSIAKLYSSWNVMKDLILEANTQKIRENVSKENLLLYHIIDC